MSELKTRDHSIDILRGMAIFAMIAANMAAHNYTEPHPYIFRLFGSFAAPTFVFLSGLMVPYTTANNNHGFFYYLLRGASILVVASLMDIFLWKLIPLVSFDVLYVIGFSLPLIWLLNKLNKWFILAAALCFFIAMPFVQQLIPYQPLPNEIATDSTDIKLIYSKTSVINNLFSFGWFPLFPWMGVSLLGAFFGKIRQEKGQENLTVSFFITGTILLVSGLVVWLITKPQLLTREGYSELFYPPTFGYFMVYLGSIVLLMPLLYKVRENKLMHFFAVYGRSSLLMYILHTVTIVFFFNENFGDKPALVFAQLWLLNSFFLWWTAAFVQVLKEQVKKLPYILRFVIGG